MPRPSLGDPDEHSTIYVTDSAGANVCVGHVTTDASKQRVGSSLESNQYRMG